MAEPLLLLEQLREHLITAGLVRRPEDAGEAPVCHLPDAGRHGTPEPPAGETVVVELAQGPQIPARQVFVDGFLEERIVLVHVRAQFDAAGELLQRRIRALLAEQRGTTFGVLRVEWCRLFTGDQPTGRDGGLFHRLQGFRVGCRAKALAGEPASP